MIYEEHKALFSSPNAPDSFVLVGTGDDTLGAEISFFIISYNRDTIWSETFPSTDLVSFVSTDVNKLTPQEERSIIGQRLSTFFSEKRFSSPAISATEDFDPDYSKKDVWEDIK